MSSGHFSHCTFLSVEIDKQRYTDTGSEAVTERMHGIIKDGDVDEIMNFILTKIKPASGHGVGNHQKVTTITEDKWRRMASAEE